MSGDTTTDTKGEGEFGLGSTGVQVELRENGPIVISGSVRFDDGSGPVLSDRLFLCRCGESAKKPMCDGTHKRTGFVADGCQPPQRS